MTSLPAYKIYPLGDAALTLDFGNMISQEINDRVIVLMQHLMQQPLQGITDIVPAYSSLTVYYDVWALRKNVPEEQSVFEWMKNQLLQMLSTEKNLTSIKTKNLFIPVCYDKRIAPDLEWSSAYLKLPAEEIIRIHAGKSYRVYMLGFLPGFAYMGEVDNRITLPRKKQPVAIEAGAVGIAGKQTGVYPLSSPGGWQIIGRTPVKMFMKNEDPLCAVSAGDQVTFYPIQMNEYILLKNNPSFIQEKGLEMQYEFKNFKSRNS
jgi:inhibitor of KinA